MSPLSSGSSSSLKDPFSGCLNILAYLEGQSDLVSRLTIWKQYLPKPSDPPKSKVANV